MSTASSVRHDSAPSAAMALLAHGVPLSLLLDLAFGPRSEDLMTWERPQLPRRPEPQPA